MKRSILLTVVLACGFCASNARCDEEFRPSQQTAIADVQSRTDELKAVNQAIWNFAEVGLEEHQSASLLVSKLKQNGFEVKQGVSDMPTAFVASFGSGTAGYVSKSSA
jgi:aminobenzoyl-glutamate utilization protein B